MEYSILVGATRMPSVDDLKKLRETMEIRSKELQARARARIRLKYALEGSIIPNTLTWENGFLGEVHYQGQWIWKTKRLFPEGIIPLLQVEASRFVDRATEIVSLAKPDDTSQSIALEHASILLGKAESIERASNFTNRTWIKSGQRASTSPYGSTCIHTGESHVAIHGCNAGCWYHTAVIVHDPGCREDGQGDRKCCKTQHPISRILCMDWADYLVEHYGLQDDRIQLLETSK